MRGARGSRVTKIDEPIRDTAAIQAATYLKTKGKVFMNIVTKEQRNKKGIYTRPVFVKHLELEYWDMIHEVMKDNPELKTYADTLRFMAKRATGRI